MCNIFILSRYTDLFIIYLYIINICDEFSLSRLNNRNYYNQLLRRKEGKEEKTSRKETVTKEKNNQGGGHDRGQRGKLFHPLS